MDEKRRTKKETSTICCFVITMIIVIAFMIWFSVTTFGWIETGLFILFIFQLILFPIIINQRLVKLKFPTLLVIIAIEIFIPYVIATIDYFLAWVSIGVMWSLLAIAFFAK